MSIATHRDSYTLEMLLSGRFEQPAARTRFDPFQMVGVARGGADQNGIKQPLLSTIPDGPDSKSVTGYGEAGVLSRVWFCWLNPVLKLGSAKTLEQKDVPELAPEDETDEVYRQLNEQWQKQDGPIRKPHSFRNALLRTFALRLMKCWLLALIKVCVAYVGPALISTFMEVLSGRQSHPHQGYVLLLVLFLAKIVEATSNHQLTFTANKLGMQVRSSVISIVYRKGLRLSSSARGLQGSGTIVNLVSVDAQNIADAVQWVHNVWSIPLQIAIAGAILYPQVGASCGAALVVLVLFSILSYQFTELARTYQNGYMKNKDVRVQRTTDSLASIKVIKLQAWDENFLREITLARGLEFRQLSKFVLCFIMLLSSCFVAPVAASVAVFAYAVFFGQSISVGGAFTTVTIARSLQDILRLLPNLSYTFAQATVSLERVEHYLWSEELQSEAVERLPWGAQEHAIVVRDGFFKWGAEAGHDTLREISLEIKPGALVAIAGKVGAGKTSLLSALQGEMIKVSGLVKTCGSTACVAQTPWIQNATIRENILFGRPFEKESYDLVLRSCSLVADLDQMPDGDRTEIGERGLNLSGGQKQRIQLARALYQDCDIYFLDDVFSAVDAHTGSHLFKECVLGALKEKTVVLITHQIEFLPKADLLLVMREGRIVQSGKYEDILQEGTDLEALVIAHHSALELIDSQQERREDRAYEPGQFPKDRIGRQLVSQNGQVQTEVQAKTNNTSEGSDEGQETQGGRLVLDERKDSGSVSFHIYKIYFTKIGYGLPLIFMVLCLCLGQLGLIASDLWISLKIDYDKDDSSEARRFLYVYMVLSVFGQILVCFRPVVMGAVGLILCQRYFFEMMKSVFRAPMSFFDTTPNGRILSRATTDQANVDFVIPAMFGGLVAVIVTFMGNLLVTGVIVRQVIILAVPLMIFTIIWQRYYLSSSRELTRLDGITKAPIIHHFSETIAGLSNIRCFNQQEWFIRTTVDRVNTNFKLDFHNNASTEWVGVRMELAGCCFICFAVLLLVVAPNGFIASEKVGLALTYALNMNAVVYSVNYFYCFLENRMISVERLQQFSAIPSEAEMVKEDVKLSKEWPLVGSIELDNFKLRYRSNTPLVLKGISVKIGGGEKVGVVGRTGSGKSTLILALFRLVESSGGRILIDGIDVSTLGLYDLRSRLSIMPQDPTLFNGTVRLNLDPFKNYSDAEIWQVLEKCQLKRFVSQLEGKLESLVISNGENWSVGQRQLLCLGRVLLKRTKILVLDEATSSVDTETDAVMQKILQQDFADCTVISIAHRVPSVMESDKVLVLDAGLVKEFDSPTALREQPTSLFSALVSEYYARASS